MLIIRNLSKHFGGLAALSDINLDIKDGFFWGLIGPNGSGKSTLLNVISGIYPASAGYIHYNGTDITALKPNIIARHGIARTFQRTRLFFEMTAIDNVLTGQHSRATNSGLLGIWPFYGMKQDKALVEEAEGLLDLLGLSKERNQFAKEIPYGSQRRLEIARALASKPSILLLDEPAAGMNRQDKKELMDSLNKVCSSGITIILIEHNVSMVMELSQRVVVLNFGLKIAEGTPEEIRNNDLVIEAYLGRTN